MKYVTASSQTRSRTIKQNEFVPSKSQPLGQSYKKASPTAWLLVSLSGICIAFAVFLASRTDLTATATIASTPWLVLILLAVGPILLLAGTNVDLSEDPPAVLFQKGVRAVATLAVLSVVGACMAIASDGSVQTALQWGMATSVFTVFAARILRKPFL